jgi:hypothetical protein
MGTSIDNAYPPHMVAASRHATGWGWGPQCAERPAYSHHLARRLWAGFFVPASGFWLFFHQKNYSKT